MSLSVGQNGQTIKTIQTGICSLFNAGAVTCSIGIAVNTAKAFVEIVSISLGGSANACVAGAITVALTSSTVVTVTAVGNTYCLVGFKVTEFN